MKKLNHKNQVLAEKLASQSSFQALSEAELETLVGGKKGDVAGDPSQWLLTRRVNEYEGQHL